jgi:hypothetical protein
MVGATAVIGAGVTFLMQQVDMADHLVRYAMFLGLTVVMCGLGFFCGLRLRDNKGARTMLLLTLAVVPVHFMQLGALLFSQFGDSAFVTQANESVFAWLAPSPSAALGALALGAIVLSPMVGVAMRTLVRSEAASLSGMLLATNAVLLVPSRDPSVTAGLAVLLLLSLLNVQREFYSSNAALKTPEARMVQGILWAPLVLIMGRTVYLYASEVNAIFLAAFLGITAELLFSVSAMVWRQGAVVRRFQALSLLPGAAAPVVLAVSVRGHVPDDMWIPFFGLAAAGYLFLTSLRRTEIAQGVRELGVNVVAFTAVLQMIAVHGPISSLLLIFASVLVLVSGYVSRRKANFTLGIAGIAYGLVYHIRYAIEVYSVSPWVSLAALGLGAVLVSSLLEGQTEFLKARLGHLRERFLMRGSSPEEAARVD